MKLCKDCKYCSTLMSYWCEHPSVGISVVDGRYNPTLCIVMRNNESKCGKAGRLFESKEFPDPWYITIKNSILNL